MRDQPTTMGTVPGATRLAHWLHTKQVREVQFDVLFR